MLLRELLDAILLEQRATCATQRRVCLDDDALLFAEVDDLLLWKIRVVLDLVGSWNDFGLFEQVL